MIIAFVANPKIFGQPVTEKYGPAILTFHPYAAGDFLTGTHLKTLFHVLKPGHGYLLIITDIIFTWKEW
jgi:hypothetical protein